MTKSSGAEQARRVNLTMRLLQQRISAAEVLAKLMARYGVCRRQAYRYVQRAQQAASPLAVPEAKAVFTVKLPHRLMAQVRREARRQRSSISLWVEEALQRALDQRNGHG